MPFELTEEEWFDSDVDPEQMYYFLDDKLTERKCRLFGCACVRAVWEHLPVDALRQAIEICERYAVGLVLQQ